MSEHQPGVCAADSLAGAEILSDLPRQIVEAIAEISSTRSFSAGETIFSPGQFDGADLLYLAEGGLKGTHADAATGSMMVEPVAPKSFFGLALAVIAADQMRFSGLTLSADQDSTVIFIDAEGFRGLVAQRPLLARSLLMAFAKASTGSGGAPAQEAAPERRVFAAIAALVRRDAVEANWKIAKMPKHRDLADLAEVGENDAATAVAKLISSGVARRDYPGLVIDDMTELNRLAR